MAETRENWKDCSTSNVIIPRQIMIANPAPNVIRTFVLPAYIQRYRIRMQAANAPFDYSFDPLMVNFETIPGNQAIIEEVIYRRDLLPIYFRSAVGNTNFQITYWCDV